MLYIQLGPSCRPASSRPRPETNLDEAITCQDCKLTPTVACKTTGRHSLAFKLVLDLYSCNFTGFARQLGFSLLRATMLLPNRGPDLPTSLAFLRLRLEKCFACTDALLGQASGLNICTRGARTSGFGTTARQGQGKSKARARREQGESKARAVVE